MLSHLRGLAVLTGLTLLLCSVLYPLALLGVGKVMSGPAEGSLLAHPDGGDKPVGSRLIAQPFEGDEYFHPRPSAAGSAGYDATASGPSNLGPSNYQLRERVAQDLGPIVRYKHQKRKATALVGPDVEDWVLDHPEVIDDWAKNHADSPERWLKASKSNAELVGKWKKSSGTEGDPAPEDVVPFLKAEAAKAAAAKPREWSAELHEPVQRLFFESWRAAHEKEDLEDVPADLLTTSGSGLDPHITLANANYQLDEVVAAWVKKTGARKEDVRKEIEDVLREKASAPFGGLFGVPLVNVLEVNLAVRERMKKFPHSS
jgi:K+-transporting ATPase ATPase C chain